MDDIKKIKTALISVYSKDKLEDIVRILEKNEVDIYSTGGTYDFIQNLGIRAQTVESLTSYPGILGGRVKTLHPKIFGGILGRRDHHEDRMQMDFYQIPSIDLVIVDLYPFEETIRSTGDEHEIIEKIDIGGIALIRAAAKNFHDVVVVPSSDLYDVFVDLYTKHQGAFTLDERKWFALQAFNVSSHYDTLIYQHFRHGEPGAFKQSILHANQLRYGENPHQDGIFYGHPGEVFTQLQGKAISYNNIGDLDAALHLISEFDEPTFAIIKHNNACGLASRPDLTQAWKDALAADPLSAFGGVLVTNAPIGLACAQQIHSLFFEIILAPGFEKEALALLGTKKNRIILQQKQVCLPDRTFRSALNGVIEQSKDLKTETVTDMKPVTRDVPSRQELNDLVFANKIVKHSRSNAIVLAKNKQLLASGIGQTSRVDALKQAIAKARGFGFGLQGAVLASDAFFPFADSVEIAHAAGITAIVQPGGSVRDQDSIDFCDTHHVAMVFTGIRHFKH
ncbi:MAG TPA: bifunctional phosphoribosylaminoimidazolecarboxamide formyltransferase/IMP cyclohydrolase [Bacteroidales bacterium]|nr:bifunctional phosphoribosylaminoimidazolecarboxamide formyltransferase/IMP cyclohydrolase [Bacteroidales bacterium]HNS46755.1 bifunctional phosphoribosylaminoimidazolecarboxamide formyltransferase/IMP cyclohydrolase [Bacteroidales bacterium]